MSVDCYFFIEVKDAEGKWHLVKWYTDGNFDECTETDILHSFESNTEIDGQKYVVKRETWTGLQLRDELSWSRHWAQSSVILDKLPDDISPELDKLLKEKAERDIESRKKYHGEDYTFDYHRAYSHIYLNDLWEMCDNKMSEWRKAFIERVKDKQLEEINQRLEHLEKVCRNGEKTKAFNKKKVEEDYEDTVQYYLDEYLEEAIALRMEVKMLSTIAQCFTGDRWLHSENVRVIYYMD